VVFVRRLGVNPADIQNMIDRYAAAELSVLEEIHHFQRAADDARKPVGNPKRASGMGASSATLNNKRRGRPGYRLARFG
jgi:hypothetical protein